MAGQWNRCGVVLIVLAVLLAVATQMPARAQSADDFEAQFHTPRWQLYELRVAGNYAEATAVAKRWLEQVKHEKGYEDAQSTGICNDDPFKTRPVWEADPVVQVKKTERKANVLTSNTRAPRFQDAITGFWVSEVTFKVACILKHS